MTEIQRHQSSTGFAEGIAGVAAGMNVAEELRGVHATVRLESPVEVGVYGGFDERLDYTRGCVLGNELSNSNMALAFRLTSAEGSVRVVSIGRTPKGLQVPSGVDPGVPGEFLLVAQEENGANPSARFLDQEDLNGVLATNGQEDILFAGNHARQRQLKLPGTVEQLTGFRRSVSRRV